MRQPKTMPEYKTMNEMKSELEKLYKTPTTRAQREEIGVMRQEYEGRAQELVEEFMQREIDILNDIKLKLSI